MFVIVGDISRVPSGISPVTRDLSPANVVHESEVVIQTDYNLECRVDNNRSLMVVNSCNWFHETHREYSINRTCNRGTQVGVGRVPAVFNFTVFDAFRLSGADSKDNTIPFS